MLEKGVVMVSALRSPSIEIAAKAAEIKVIHIYGNVSFFILFFNELFGKKTLPNKNIK